MNNTFRGKDLFYVLQSDVSDIPKTPEPVVSANFLDTPFVKPNTDDTSNDNITFLRIKFLVKIFCFGVVSIDQT